MKTMSPNTSRASGILLHITSLPDTEPVGPEQPLTIQHPGSGDFGPSAYHFIDWLEHAEQYQSGGGRAHCPASHIAVTIKPPEKRGAV